MPPLGSHQPKEATKHPVLRWAQGIVKMAFHQYSTSFPLSLKPKHPTLKPQPLQPSVEPRNAVIMKSSQPEYFAVTGGRL